MIFIRAIVEGMIMAVIYVYVTRKSFKWTWAVMAGLISASLICVVSLYHGQENSSYFFWHPYISWMMVNVADYLCGNNNWKEKVFLWPFVVIPIISGFELTIGWTIKIYM